MKKILKNKKVIFFILLSIIVLLRLFLTSSFLPYIRAGFRFDDLMMFDMTKNLINGNYLGQYNELILVKGIMYPLFVAILNFIKMPYLLGMDLLYIFAILFFVNSIKKVIKKKSSLLLIIIILLFNPIAYSRLTFLVFYRNWFDVCIIIIYFASLINLYFKKNIINAIILGLIFSVAFFTREDYMWLIPSLILVLIFTKTKIMTKLIPLGTFICIFLLISFLNYTHYGIFTPNEFSKSNFKDTYATILKIDANTFSEKIKLTSENSPTFKLVYDEMVLAGYNNELGYRNSQFMWIFRENVAKLGYYESYEKADEFYNKIDTELDNSELEFKNSIIPVIVANPSIDSLYKIPSKTISTFNRVITYDDLYIGNGYTFDGRDKTKDFEEVINQDVLRAENTLNSLDGFEKIAALNSILDIYQKTGIITFILGIASYIYLIIKRKRVFIQSIILLSITIFIMGVIYTDITSFNAISYYYLAPAYIFIPIFSIINIFSVYEIILNKYYKKIK